MSPTDPDPSPGAEPGPGETGSPAPQPAGRPAAGQVDDLIEDADLVELVRDQEKLITDLRAKLASSGVINKAIGIIMAQSNCGEDQAFALLAQVSQRSNRKVRDVASEILSRYDSRGRRPSDTDD
ncbi:ANTAR domain-containing protein [Allonocardiopsis opalescens]|uniref:ANTAR domain-containing protein n=1 Tax=Allonocardiopsis opalescens TaxID=1144618 RepID=A0A2T0QAY1_9ACTN|nr:ANTAR domain-containing protein [Allonocardiopsis opalescens]PRY01029.1 ANTAR domain-containing protein [Allonocardiopsis opalescens]